MKKATDTVLKQFGQNPSLLPNNVTLDAIYFLDNSYLEYNNNFYRQTIGGPMGSPLTVALAEVRVTEIETLAINSCQKPPKHYRHFVVDGFGQFTCKQHADEFLQHLNSLIQDLQYTIEHPSTDGSLPYFDVLIIPTNQHQYTENQPTPTYTRTIPQPHPPPQKTQ